MLSTLPLAPSVPGSPGSPANCSGVKSTSPAIVVVSHRVRYFRGRNPNFNQSGVRKLISFLAPDL